jgi:hypothetical protein
VGRLNSSSYAVFLGLIGLCVLVGSIVVWWLRRDIEGDTPVSEEDVFRDLERAYFAGQMDRAEFERVTASLRSMRPGVSLPMPPTAAVQEVPSEPDADPEGGEDPAAFVPPS